MFSQVAQPVSRPQLVVDNWMVCYLRLKSSHMSKFSLTLRFSVHSIAWHLSVCVTCMLQIPITCTFKISFHSYWFTKVKSSLVMCECNSGVFVSRRQLFPDADIRCDLSFQQFQSFGIQILASTLSPQGVSVCCFLGVRDKFSHPSITTA
jgi:hypothetical protein